MSSASNAELDSFVERPPTYSSETRPLYWSVRRELWENRSIYLAPLVTAAVALFGFLVSTITLRGRMHDLLALDAARQRVAINTPYSLMAALMLLIAFLTGIFYCLDALHGERRDRSILFWKSLPVSDRTTVLAKAGIPLIVLPLFTFVVIIAMQMLMLAMSTVVLFGDRASMVMLWNGLPLFRMWLALLYALIAVALWHAPLYAWLLLISGWARRATLLWAVLPPVALCIFEAIAFHTSHFASLLRYRVIGWFPQGFAPYGHRTVPADPLTALDPGKLLTTPGLWLGLAFAAAAIAAAIRMRRYKEPI